MVRADDCGCITVTLEQRGKLSQITQLCSKHAAEAELDQQETPTLQAVGSNPACGSNAPSPNGDGSRLMSGPNLGSSPSGAIDGP